MSKNTLFWRPASDRQVSWFDDNSAREPRLWLWALATSLLVMVFQIINHLTSSADFVGIDPDDTMRLVQIRDFLAGQGWFDLHQYRLGLDGGTLMHWSRLVDLPITALMLLFGLVTDTQTAEALALAVWPLALIVPLMAASGTVGFRLGGQGGLVASLVLTAIIVMEMIRFRIGAIDHHNLQLVLMATMAACLIDPALRAGSFALAGCAGALALAIGAETTPIVAVAAMVVAVLWAVRGDAMRSATLAFSAAIALATLGFFLLTTPVARMTAVTCDNLSFGYMTLTVGGGCLLFLASLAASSAALPWRAGVLAGIGVLVGLMALQMMPHCLVNPLGDLDPFLVKVWLNKVSEAQSLSKVLSSDAAFAGSFYAIGILGFATALFRIRNSDRVQAHAILAALVGMSVLVTFLQVRGMVFSNLLGALVLSCLIVDLRRLYLKRPKEPALALAFALVTLMSIPAGWSFAGAMTRMASDAIAPDPAQVAEDAMAEKPSCAQKAYLEKLSALPPGRIMAASNIGSALLRYTPHGVVAAPYHRNQSGMLAELKAGMAKPEDAESIIRGAGVTILVYCRWDPLVRFVGKTYPDGLYAELARGHAPDYLELKVDYSNPNMATFLVRPDKALASNN